MVGESVRSTWRNERVTDIGTTGAAIGGCPVRHEAALPFPRDSVVGLAPLFHTLRADAPVVLVQTPAGDPAWLVTRYADVKALYDDDRLVRSHPSPQGAARLSKSAILGGPEGDHATERADHARMRGVAQSAFSGRRMSALQPRVEEIVDDLLDRVASSSPPVDLHQEFTLPLSVQVICELLGVPFADHRKVHGWFDAAMNPPDVATGTAARTELLGYIRELVENKRRDRGVDFISHVVGEHGGETGLTDDQVVLMVVGLLLAGHHATVSFFDVGVARLLTMPEQRDALLREPSLIDGLVEEILRTAAPGTGVTPRYAGTDLRIGDVTIPAGDAVLLGFAAANHDIEMFPEPDRFDPGRQPNPHLAFGYGRHFCIGASLARIELRTGLSALTRRFPELRLAVPVEDLAFGRQFLNSGLTTLPVTW